MVYLPKRVRFGQHTVDVSLVSLPEGVHGETSWYDPKDLKSYTRPQIRISGALPSQAAAERVLWHELCHLALMLSGQSEAMDARLEEGVVVALEELLPVWVTIQKTILKKPAARRRRAKYPKVSITHGK